MSPLRWIAKFAGFCFASAVAFILVLSVLEGFCRVLPCLWEASKIVSEGSFARSRRSHLQSDSLLGWTNIPNIFIKDMYGPGVYLRTNSQGSRNNEDFPPHPPRGKVRIVCSGDSMTFGYGVDNDHTWCQGLADQDERLETVNMGQILYALDHMYLRYMRDGVKLDPDIHILALGDVEFQRLTQKDFYGMAKPTLQLQDGKLIAASLPRPSRRAAAYLVPLTHLLRNRLQLLGALTRLRRRSYNPEQNKALAVSIFESLQEAMRKNGGSFVVVFLPRIIHRANPLRDREMEFLSAELKKKGILTVDLVRDFRAWPTDYQDRIFLEDSHYSEEGNRAVAALIYNRLLAFPQTAAKLAAAGKAKK